MTPLSLLNITFLEGHAIPEKKTEPGVASTKAAVIVQVLIK